MYGPYDYFKLPTLPFDLKGDFAWLAGAPSVQRSIGDEYAEENVERLPLLVTDARFFGVALPESFIAFMTTRSLQQRVYSGTDCFIEFCPQLLRSPVGDGFLVRFLAESQRALHWYLYLVDGGKDYAVVVSPGFYGTAEEVAAAELGTPDPKDIRFCAESFEAFIAHFWFENVIWSATSANQPLPAVAAEYVRRYRGEAP